MKIILSRKGFDSAAGGHPSPLFIEEGKCMSIPIPEDNDMNIIDTGITYSNLFFDDGVTYADVMNDLGIKGFDDRYVHLDPDLNHDALKNRKNGWRGIFGQCSTAQSHLANQKVEKGDLFLFFGWFRDVKKINGKYSFINGTDKQVIWGYLQVGEIESICEKAEYEEWKLAHPHYVYRQSTNNTAYIAREKLSFNDSIPGFGCLKYDKSLALTYDGQDKRSLWKLPRFFHPQYNTKMSFHEKLADKSGNPVWQLYDDCCLLQTVGRGQEFVTTGNAEVEEWARNLILNNNEGKNGASGKKSGRAEKGSKFYFQNHMISSKDELSEMIIAASPSLQAFVDDKSKIDWKSPLESEDFREYRDDFLDVLALDQKALNEAKAKLKDFWPKNGPQWDGLAVVNGAYGQRGLLLVEAKAYPGETKSDLRAECDESVRKIESSISRVQGYYEIQPNNWTKNCYQMGNRIAYLYFMNEILNIPAWLVLINFIDGDFKRTELNQWLAHYNKLYRSMGMHHDCKTFNRIIQVFPKGKNS